MYADFLAINGSLPTHSDPHDGFKTRVAVVGSGIAGLSCAYELTKPEANCAVTLFEANAYFGGHTNTVDVTLDGVTHGVDTGFLVYNERTYPNLIKLFAELDVETVASDMSFSVNLTGAGLQWAGSNLNTVFSQRRNLMRPTFLRMLADIGRFNRIATALALSPDGGPGALRLTEPVSGFIARHGFGAGFRDWYLLPMIGAIWSCPTEQMMAFPIGTLIRFCHNHGLLQVTDRPQWRTVKGGAREYVKRIVGTLADARLNTPVHTVTRHNRAGKERVAVETEHGIEWFDHVVMACHSDQSLRLLSDADAQESAALSAIRYAPNRAVLHTDARLLPEPRAWSAWNYESRHGAIGEDPQLCVHYLLNRLQPLPFKQSVIVSLNPLREPDPRSVLQEIYYSHPVFDQAALPAQRLLSRLQGQRGTWFCGAWTGYGFHEDGLKSGLAVVKGLTLETARQRASGVRLGGVVTNQAQPDNALPGAAYDENLGPPRSVAA
jgi:predicted NAD/FAD-binding protein